jgi:hypothetical protein
VKINRIGPDRAKLDQKGMIYSPAHGDMAFTVPLFDEFMLRGDAEFRDTSAKLAPTNLSSYAELTSQFNSHFVFVITIPQNLHCLRNLISRNGFQTIQRVSHNDCGISHFQDGDIMVDHKRECGLICITNGRFGAAGGNGVRSRE